MTVKLHQEKKKDLAIGYSLGQNQLKVPTTKLGMEG